METFEYPLEGKESNKSSMDIKQSEDHLAIGDRGGCIVLFERTDARNHGSSKDLEAQDFTPSFSRESFDLPKAYFLTAQSVCDALKINWNYEMMNVKQAYYLSMEFLQGRTLLIAIDYLELTSQYAEALRLGHILKNIAEKELDVALGNGGLGRLASCFFDSLATLNYPAWGYGLRYKFGQFKQNVTKDG